MLMLAVNQCFWLDGSSVFESKIDLFNYDIGLFLQFSCRRIGDKTQYQTVYDRFPAKISAAWLFWGSRRRSTFVSRLTFDFFKNENTNTAVNTA